MAAHAGLSHALFTSNPYLLGLSTSDRAGCAVRCAAELFLNALESNAAEVRVEVRAARGGAFSSAGQKAPNSRTCPVPRTKTLSRICGVVSVAVAASERNAAGSILGVEGSGKAP